MKIYTLALLALCLASSAAQAGDIYRWVDDQGQTQMSDVGPDKYRDKATRISARKYELTPEQKADARDRAVYEAQRARDEKSLAQRAEQEARSQERERQERAEQVLARDRLARTQAKSDSAQSADNAQAQCDAAWRRYHDSVACFARFATGNAGTSKTRFRPEAFQFCTDALPPTCSPSGLR